MNREDILTRLSIRLSHLVEDSDKTLNKLLNDLRADLGRGAETGALEQISGSLAKHILLQKEKANSSDGKHLSSEEFGSELARSIRGLRFDTDSNKKLGEIAKRVQGSQHLEHQLNGVTEVLRIAQSAKTYQASRSTGRSWFGNKGQDQLQDFLSRSSQLLEEAVNHIDVLNGNTSETKTIRQQLERQPDSDAMCDLVDDVIVLLHNHSERIDEERTNTQHFLGTLRDRLLNVEEALYSFIGNKDTSDERSGQFNAIFGQEIKGLEEATKTNDINIMRKAMVSGVNSLSANLAEYLAEETEARQQGRKQIEDLNRRIHQIEEEARHLRGEIKQKQDLAIKDPLTTIYNRTGFNERIEEEIARKKRIKCPLSLVFIDCNKFKEINDTFGHAAGDIVLVQVAKALTERARITDIVARYGGDEFVVILPDTNAEGAVSFSKDVCNLILKAGFNNNGQPLDISISCGIAEISNEDSAKTALERADRAMYTAKKMPAHPRVHAEAMPN